MHFQLVSSKGTKYDDEAYEVMVPTKSGPISIFRDHMPLISAAQAGVLSVRKKAGDPDSALVHFAINGGVIETADKAVNFVADDVTTADEISEQQAAAALAHAEDLVKNAGSQVALHEAHRTLQHTSAQLHIARLKKRHHN